MLRRERDGSGSGSYGTGIDHCGTGTGSEQRTCPVQNSNLATGVRSGLMALLKLILDDVLGTKNGGLEMT